MLASHPVTTRRSSATLAVLLLGLLLATFVMSACGDGGETASGTSTGQAATPNANKRTQTASAFIATQSAKPTQTPDAQPYPGPEPKLGGNITAITPANGQAITQLDSQSPNPERPRGVCFVADFKDLPENALWFRMAVDDKEVTEELTILAASRDNPVGGRFCYAPKAGLAVGRHSAAVSVRNPNNDKDLRQLVAWRFEITK